MAPGPTSTHHSKSLLLVCYGILYNITIVHVNLRGQQKKDGSSKYFWDPFGVILGLLGTFYPSLGGHLGLFRNILGSFWGPRAVWDSLGIFWNLFGAIMYTLRSMCGYFWGFWGPF